MGGGFIVAEVQEKLKGTSWESLVPVTASSGLMSRKFTIKIKAGAHRI